MEGLPCNVEASSKRFHVPLGKGPFIERRMYRNVLVRILEPNPAVLKHYESVESLE